MATDSLEDTDTSNPDDIRAVLKELGKRRKRLDAVDEELMEEVRTALAKAEEQGVPKAESARLLNMHRTTIYRVYR